MGNFSGVRFSGGSLSHAAFMTAESRIHSSIAAGDPILFLRP